MSTFITMEKGKIILIKNDCGIIHKYFIYSYRMAKWNKKYCQSSFLSGKSSPDSWRSEIFKLNAHPAVSFNIHVWEKFLGFFFAPLSQDEDQSRICANASHSPQIKSFLPILNFSVNVTLSFFEKKVLFGKYFEEFD